MIYRLVGHFQACQADKAASSGITSTFFYFQPLQEPARFAAWLSHSAALASRTNRINLLSRISRKFCCPPWSEAHHAGSQTWIDDYRFYTEHSRLERRRTRRLQLLTRPLPSHSVIPQQQRLQLSRRPLSSVSRTSNSSSNKVKRDRQAIHLYSEEVLVLQRLISKASNNNNNLQHQADSALADLALSLLAQHRLLRLLLQVVSSATWVQALLIMLSKRTSRHLALEGAF